MQFSFQGEYRMRVWCGFLERDLERENSGNIPFRVALKNKKHLFLRKRALTFPPGQRPFWSNVPRHHPGDILKTLSDVYFFNSASSFLAFSMDF